MKREEEPQQQDWSDRRRYPRSAVIWSGNLSKASEEIGCVVRNVSANGAKLQMAEPTEKGPIRATYFRVEVSGKQPHRTFKTIRALLEGAPLAAGVRTRSRKRSPWLARKRVVQRSMCRWSPAPIMAERRPARTRNARVGP